MTNIVSSPSKLKQFVYKIAQKSSQQLFEDNTKMSAVITLSEFLTWSVRPSPLACPCTNKHLSLWHREAYIECSSVVVGASCTLNVSFRHTTGDYSDAEYPLTYICQKTYLNQNNHDKYMWS